MTLLRIDRLSAGYGQDRIIHDITFDVRGGEIVGLLGPNGSGKTTLFKAIAGSLPHSGSCFIKDSCLEKLKVRQLARLIGYIPQRSGISIDISVLDVVLMGANPRLGLLENPGRELTARALELICQVGLGGREHDNYLTLSEGLKQQCIFARALLSDASILLLDEPESSLDIRYRYMLLDKLREWSSEGRRGALVTLHDPVLALNCCDRLILIDNGRIASELELSSAPCESIEAELSMVFGPLCVRRIADNSGREQFAVLREG